MKSRALATTPGKSGKNKLGQERIENVGVALRETGYFDLYGDKDVGAWKKILLLSRGRTNTP